MKYNRFFWFILGISFSCYGMQSQHPNPYTYAILNAFLKYHDLSPESLSNVFLPPCYLPGMYITLHKDSTSIIFKTGLYMNNKGTAHPTVASYLFKAYQNQEVTSSSLDSCTQYIGSMKFGFIDENSQEKLISLIILETVLSKNETKKILKFSSL